jgi:nitrile hydratase
VAARHAVGARVAVKPGNPPGHVRTPFYIRGQCGVIERVCGAFRNPEELAYGRSGEPKQVLYRVRFDLATVWPDYAGPKADTIDIELYEHWLEAAP